VLDPSTGKVLAQVPAGADAVALADHDGDGWTDLVLCGAEGVRWARGTPEGLAALATLTTDACGAVAWFAPQVGERDLVVAGLVVRTWKIGADGTLSSPADFVDLSGPPLLVADGARFAVAARGEQEVTERSEWGRSVYAARDPIGDLARGPRNWAWTLPSANVVEDVTRRRVPVAASPGALRGADLDGDGAEELLVLHPDAVGVLAGDTEQTFPLQAPARDLEAADVDGDGCLDLLLLRSDAEVVVRPGTCAPAGDVVQGTTRATRVPLDDRDRTVTAYVGHPVRLELVDPKGLTNRYSARGGPSGLKVDEDGSANYLPTPDDVGEWVVNVRMWGGSEIVRVVPIHLVVKPANAWVASGQPGNDHGQLVLGEERPIVQVLVGGTLVVQAVDGVGEATRFTLHGGPPGLKMTSSGLITYTPLAEQIGQWDVDVRLSGGESHRKTGFQLRVAPKEVVSAAHGSQLATAAAAAAARPRDAGFWQVRGCMVSLGVAAGLTGTSQSWAYVGRPVYFSFSPVLAGTCEGGPIRGVNWFVGGETAPLYAYLLNADNIGVHTLVATVGLSFGGDRLRVGPYVSGGILMTAAGARLWWLPFVNRAGTPHGFELRVAWIFAQTPSAQGMLMYGWRLGRLR